MDHIKTDAERRADVVPLDYPLRFWPPIPVLMCPECGRNLAVSLHVPGCVSFGLEGVA